jgi:2-polyprenyl-3-methyl-5-hydroxy-6-metoxy-1,4-benzoquinol methylase
MKAFRKFDWCSSNDYRNKEKLDALELELKIYYSSLGKRQSYNEMLEKKGRLPNPEGAEAAFLEWFQKQKISNILEIGCGMGWMYERLQAVSSNIHYTGVELDDKQINENENKYPEAKWLNKSVNELDFEPEKFECVFSLYVLEHLVYPESALNTMVSLVKPGGYLLLVFPDFVEKGNLPSQHLGFGYERTAMAKIRRGNIFDGLLSYMDSRFFLPKALKQIEKLKGEFWINWNPLCLRDNIDVVWPDIDAVYIANKTEVAFWARKNNLEIEYPFGTNGFFAHHAFLAIKKPA